MDNTTCAVFFSECRIFEIIRILRFLFCIEVIKRTHEFVEAMSGGESAVGISKVILPELCRRVTLCLQQLGNGYIPSLKPFLRSGKAYFQKTSSKTRLTGDKTSSSGCATLLTIPVGEKCTLFCNAIDVGSLVAHHPLVVGTHIPVTNVIAPKDKDIGFLFLLLCRRNVRGSNQRKE